MQIARIFDLLDRFRANPDTIGRFKFGIKESGNWKEYSAQEYLNIVNEVSCGLLELGFGKGDKIATVSNNRPEWNFLEMGASQIGMVHVPIHATLSTEEIVYILNHSEAKVLVVSDKALYEKLEAARPDLSFIEKIFTFNQVDGALNWSEVVAKGQKNLEIRLPEIVKIKDTIQPDDLLTLIYTSGTTGTPKGVMLSHRNIVSNAISSSKCQHLNYNHKVLSFLPLSHIFEHMVSYQYQYLGVSVYYTESLSTIAADIRELQVDGFITVPRLLESIYEKIVSKAKTLSRIKRAIFAWAVGLSKSYAPYARKSLVYRLQLALADKLVFSKWRAVLSPNISFIGCGGAALQPRLARIFWTAGLPVFEGYGLTETSPIISVNYSKPGQIKLGTVGPVLDDVTVKIAEDGEILAKGPNIMMGYYKDEEHTREAIDSDGWFHTGDIGELVDNKFLKITDRKKEIFKMSNGKYIAPQQIENMLKESFFVQQTMVVGENQKFASAFIIPNFDALKEWAKKHKITFQSRAEAIRMPQVVKHFENEIKHLNRKLNSNEQIKKIILLADEWSHTSGELTTTLKLRRKKICEKYHELVDAVYASSKFEKTAKLKIKSGKQV